MENNKYYIPKIEEFHIGFEYECKLNDSSWVKNIYNKLSEINFEEFSISQNNIRVKYLDSDDIESFNFKYDEKLEEYVSNKTFLGLGCGDDSKIHIYYDELHRFMIYRKNNRGQENVIVDEMIINNINDFKKILKFTQLLDKLK